MKGSKVSIIITTYNRLPLLKKALQSAINQVYANKEIIVINDASDDGTEDYLDSCKQSINVIHNSENIGLQRSLNIAISFAEGEYIARLDDDDYWIDPSKLSQQIDFLDSHLDHALIGSSYRSHSKVYNNPLTDEDIRKQILFRCPFRHSTVMFRRSVWDSLGGYDEKLPFSEDWDLWLRLGRHFKFANTSHISTHINEDNNASQDFFIKQFPLNSKILSSHWADYPSAWKARLYHQFVFRFFQFFKLNGFVHKIMQSVFRRCFQVQ